MAGKRVWERKKRRENMNFRIFIVIFLTLSEANGKFTKTYKKRSQSYNYYSFNLKSPATKTIFWIYGLMPHTLKKHSITYKIYYWGPIKGRETFNLLIPFYWCAYNNNNFDCSCGNRSLFPQTQIRFCTLIKTQYQFTVRKGCSALVVSINKQLY